MILYTAADLLWASKIKAAAIALGLEARPVRTVEMLADRLADTEPTGLLVDLESDVAIEIIEAGAKARAEDGRPGLILAFGPHVHVEAFEAAKAAGADQALARGAVASRLDEVLTRLAAPA